MQGCHVSESELKPQDPSNEAYKVQIYGDISQQPASKVAVDEGFCTGDQVGLYIVNYDGETPGTLKLEGNQADNVRFSYNENGEWVSDYDVFYKDNDTKVDFYGYYPYADPTSIEAYPFEVAKDQSKAAEHGQMATYEASDFLWAKTAKVTPTSSKVILTFRHAMSSARVRFTQGSGWTDAAEYAAATKEVLVNSTIRKSIIDLSTGVVTPQGDAPLDGIVPLNDHGDFRAIVVPQTVPAGKSLLTITIGGVPRNYVRDVDTEYLPGKITNFDLAIKKIPATGEYEIELLGVNITAWEADNVSHGEDAREYVVVNNAIPGDLEKTIVDRLEMDPTKIKNLKLLGKITTADYDFMRNKMTSLQRLNLKEVESLIDGVYKIPRNAFNGKKTLIKCVLPDKLERIEDGAFTNSSLAGAVLLPEGLKYVAGFDGTKITNIAFPSSLEEIGTAAFAECKSLMCEVSFPESLRIIGERAFLNSSIRGNVILPLNLEGIETRAFEGCSNLTGSLTIPSRIKKIGGSAFRDCSGLTGALQLPKGLEQIEGHAFCGAKLKGELIIPESVSEIGINAFEGTLFSGSLVLPKELILLGTAAFRSCWRLSGVIEIPKNIISVPSQLFYGCSGIEGIKLHKDIEVVKFKSVDDCKISSIMYYRGGKAGKKISIFDTI